MCECVCVSTTAAETKTLCLTPNTEDLIFYEAVCICDAE